MSAALHARPLPADRERWWALLDRLDLDSVTEDFLSEVRHLPDYHDPPIPWSQIMVDATASFQGLVSALRTGDDEQMESIATRVGVTRARAKVPLASLLTAIRLDFSLLWQELISVGQDDEVGILLRHASVVSETVEKYVQMTQHAFLLEERRMADDVASVRRGLVSELMTIQPQSVERAQDVARQLEIGVDWEYTVFAAFDEQMAAARVEAATLERRGVSVLTAHHGSALVLIIAQDPSRSPEDLDSLLALRVGVVERVQGLTRLGAAVRMAEELATVFTPEEAGAMTPVRGWSRLVRLYLQQSPLAGVFNLDELLAGCGVAERLAVESTVRSFLATGSTAVTAQELYCHRNTVTNRLRRFTELTGIDLLVPDQAARAVIAFA